jgi:hypothetical protein
MTASKKVGPYQMLGAVLYPGMRAEVRQFPRGPVGQASWTAPTNILTFRFSPGNTSWTRPMAPRTAYLPDGPLTFRPRAATWESKTNAVGDRTRQALQYESA